MRSLRLSATMALWGAFALTVALLFAEKARGQEFIDRRDQARGAFKSTPAGLYRHYCAHCHGDDARGGGRLWAMALEPKPPDLTQSSLEEAALVKFMADGSGAVGRSNLCPPWGRTLSAQDLKRLSRYIATLGDERPVPRPGSADSAELRRSEPFPWGVLVVLLVEVVVLWRMARLIRRTSERSTFDGGHPHELAG